MCDLRENIITAVTSLGCSLDYSLIPATDAKTIVKLIDSAREAGILKPDDCEHDRKLAIAEIETRESL
tara:strand:+ start:185 stop:388 length:204 start_codon:yes stop_codon:yes gene_type:complete